MSKKLAILLTGGNCAGKTTAAEIALSPWNKGEAKDPRIESIRADNDGRFKGKSEEQEAALTEVWKSPVEVVLFEGTRINTPLARVAKRLPEERELMAIICLQTPEVMRAHLEARCKKRSKTFRADYWDRRKCEYEGRKRYVNRLRKDGVKFTSVEIDLEYKAQQEVVELIRDRIREVLGS